MDIKKYNSLILLSALLLLVFSAYFVGIHKGQHKNIANDKLNIGFAGGSETQNRILGEIFSIQANDAAIESDSDFVLIEYSDFECPFCARFHKTAQRLVDEDKLTWVYRHLPLRSIHPTALDASVISECVKKHFGEEAFWSYTNSIFDSNSRSVLFYKTLAEEYGLDAKTIEACENDQSILSSIFNNIETARLLGITGTPGGFVFNKMNGNYERLPGAVDYETMLKIINSLK